MKVFRLQGTDKFDDAYRNITNRIPKDMLKERIDDGERLIYSMRDSIWLKKTLTFSREKAKKDQPYTENVLQSVYMPYYLISKNKTLYYAAYNILKDTLKMLESEDKVAEIDLSEGYKKEFLEFVEKARQEIDEITPVDTFLSESGYFSLKDYFEDGGNGYPDSRE